MYYFAEQFHLSGVLAVVAGGLLLSSKRHKMMTYQGRVQGITVWNTIGFVLNGLVFMLIGLQLPFITSQVEEVSLGQAIWYGVLISIVLIITRLCSTLGAALFTRFAGRFITVADRRPGFRIPFVFGWAGMRGVVSLAAALSIPVLISEGQPFPYRNLILVITFVVILVTLVFQGLTLPWVIRKMKIDDDNAYLREAEQALKIRKRIADVSLRFLNEHQRSANTSNQHLRNLIVNLETESNVFGRDLIEFNGSSRKDLIEYQHTHVALLEHQRAALRSLNLEDGYDEELIRKYLSIIDLEEMKLRDLDITSSSEK
jgi:CPA1 family monovalent cation:H+ antiporter